MNEFNDLEGCRRLLREIAAMCEDASASGSLGGGARRTVLRYNRVLQHLIETETVSAGLFSPLPEDVGYDEIGVEARMLASHIKKCGRSQEGLGTEDRGLLVRLAPFVDKDDLTLLVGEQLRQGLSIGMEQLTQLAPFLCKDQLGDLLRGHLSAAATTTPISEGKTHRASGSAVREIVSVETPGDDLDDLVELLKNPYLSREERSDLVNRIRKSASRQHRVAVLH